MTFYTSNLATSVPIYALSFLFSKPSPHEKKKGKFLIHRFIQESSSKLEQIIEARKQSDNVEAGKAQERAVIKPFGHTLALIKLSIENSLENLFNMCPNINTGKLAKC